MSQPNSPSPSNTPDIVSLVLHSKKALQHGEQLCSTAHDQTQATTSVGTELLALDAKAQWIARGIYDQLKVRRYKLFGSKDANVRNAARG